MNYGYMMHYTAMQYGKFFFDIYAKQSDLIIIDIGAQDVNGSLREVAPKNSNYVGVDFAKGKGVDVILDDPYKYPFPDNYADIVVTSSCLEHSQFFWQSFIEALRILKPSGLLYINVPSNGQYHTYPTDNWRFYPDAAKALNLYANSLNYNSILLESFTAEQEKDIWNDFIAVFVKDDKYINSYPYRIHKILAKDLKLTNIWTYGNDKIINLQPKSEDVLKLESCQTNLNNVIKKSNIKFLSGFIIGIILSSFTFFIFKII